MADMFGDKGGKLSCMTGGNKIEPSGAKTNTLGKSLGMRVVWRGVVVYKINTRSQKNKVAGMLQPVVKRFRRISGNLTEKISS